MRLSERLFSAACVCERSAEVCDASYLMQWPPVSWKRIPAELDEVVDYMPPAERERALAIAAVMDATRLYSEELIDLQEWSNELREIAAALRKLAVDAYTEQRARILARGRK